MQPAADYEPDDFRSIASFADDLLDLLDEMGVARCIYVGHSMAGMVGMLAAIEAPERFERLVLMNSSPALCRRRGYVGGFARADIDGIFEAILANYHAWVSGFAPLVVGEKDGPAVDDFAAGLLAMRPDSVSGQRRRRADGAGDRSARIAADAARADDPDPFAQRRDRPRCGRALHERAYLRSELVWLPAAKGHLPHLHASAAVRRTIIAALEA
ncbi:alpha/beta fold hydrolase [Sphingomonas sp. MMS24-JH45]